MPEYNPPVLNCLITIRNPADEPSIQYDRYGRPVLEPDWGIQVWANKRDQTPFTELGEGVQVRAGRSVFTIRHRSGISPDSEVIDSDDTPFVLIGAPVERGGANAEMAACYLELHCHRRSAQETG